jgi:hypothetical protein
MSSDLPNSVAFDDLASADLVVDAVYCGGRAGNAGDDPFPKLLGMSNQGGFRFRGDLRGKIDMLLLTSTFSDTDWPDRLDPETGVFTYYGDNKQPGRLLHETGRGGNEILKRIFELADGDQASRSTSPPIFVFARAGKWRDAKFLGLAVPGLPGHSVSEDLVAIWRSSRGERFQNYRARFTILEAPMISREWINGIITGAGAVNAFAPAAWLAWTASGKRTPLAAARTIEHRTRQEQSPPDTESEAMLEAVRAHFSERPTDFEHFAAALVRMMLPDTVAIDVTRPSRDGGRDGVGQMRVGRGPGAIIVDFALEAKCYTPPNAVGVREMSRLISRLRHRQFGVLVTTSVVDLQAYREIKEDGHPIVIMSAADIAALLRENGRGDSAAVKSWLAAEFPPTAPVH